jgi:tape measure domain-containing protein
MASASSQRGGGSSGGGQSLNRSGLVYSVGLERYVNRARQAESATWPLVAVMQNLTAVSDRLSNASGSIRLPGAALQTTATGLAAVSQQSQGAASRMGQLAGGAAQLATRLVTAIAVVSALARVKSLLSGEGQKTASALGFAATAAGVMGGKISPLAGLTSAFVGVMNLLPFQLGKFGNTALSAGLGLGVLSGGIGPVTAGFSLLSLGLRGIPGPIGKVVTAAGGMITTFGLTSAAITALTTTIATLSVGLLALAPGLAFGVKLASEAEQSQIAFEVMLGSAEKAKSLLGDIRNFANSTPFGKSELIAAARALIAFGESADTVVPLLGRLGDVSSGLQIPIGELADIYGKARVQGRLFAQDMNQLTGRGIALYELLAEQFGTTTESVKRLVTEGKVGFANLEQAFVTMTSAGGTFYGLTAKQSQSIAGLWSTFKDQVLDSLQSVGEKLVETGSLQRSMAAIGSTFDAITPAAVSLAVVVGELMNGFAYFAEVVNGVARVVTWVAGSVSGWSTALKIVGPALGAVTAAVVTMTIAKKALAIAQATVLALSGPKGWFLLGVGLAAAGVATYQLTKAMNSAGASASKSAEGVAKLDAATRSLAAGPPIDTSRYQKIKDLIEKYAGSSAKLVAELREIDRYAPNPKFQKQWEEAAIDAATGIGGQIRSLADEIERLNGRTTEAAQKFRDLQNLPPAAAPMVAQLKALQDQRDALRERNSLWERASKSQKSDASAEQSRRDGLQSMRESLDPTLRLMSELREASKLVRNAEQRTLFERFSKSKIADFSSSSTDWKSNTAATRGTSEAMSAIIAATSAKATNQKTEELIKASNDLLAAIDQKLADLNATSIANQYETGSAF